MRSLRLLYPALILLLFCPFFFLPPFPVPSSRLLVQAERLIEHHPDSSLLFLRRIPLSTLDTPAESALYGLLLTQALYHTGHPAVNDSLILRSADYYSRNGNTLRHFTSLLYLSNVYLDIGNTTLAYQSGMKALDILPPDTPPRLVALLHNTLFYISRNQGDLSTAVHHYECAYFIHQRHGYWNWQFVNRYNVLNHPYFLTHPDSAAVLIDSLHHRMKLVTPSHRSSACNNIGRYYEMCGDTLLSLRYYHLALQGPSPSSAALLNLGKHYDRMGQFSISDSLFQHYLPFSTPAGKVELSRTLLFRSYRTGSSSLLPSAVRYESALRAFYEENHLYELSAIRSESLSERLLSNYYRKVHLILVTVFLLIILLFLTWYFHRLYVRRLLRLQRLCLLRLTGRLHRLRVESATLQELHAKVSSELSSSLEDLRLKDLQIFHWKSVCCEVSDTLTPADIQSLNFYIEVRYLKRPFRSESDLVHLEHWMNLVHHSFSSRLCYSYPFLTVNERSLIYFLRMGFSLSEISDIFGILPRSLQQRIFRCCGRLGIPSHLTGFVEFVRSL